MNNIDEIKFKEGQRHRAGMTVPDNFFATFQANLEKEIDRLEAQKGQQASLRIESQTVQPRIGRWTRVASIAACAIILVGLGLFAYSFDQENPAATSDMVAETSDEGEYSEADQMILSSFDDLYLYDLYCDASN